MFSTSSDNDDNPAMVTKRWAMTSTTFANTFHSLQDTQQAEALSMGGRDLFFFCG